MEYPLHHGENVSGPWGAYSSPPTAPAGSAVGIGLVRVEDRQVSSGAQLLPDTGFESRQRTS